MKIKNILLTGVAALSLVSCNDYLDVKAPSAYDEEFVFSQTSEIERALNGVYAQAIAGNLYGGLYQKALVLNSDVDITISSSPSHQHGTFYRFDSDASQDNDNYKFWVAAYNLIEYCNKFISSVENSQFFQNKNDNPEWEQDRQVMQWLGEAQCLRAMAYHDLVVYFGDVPFSFSPASKRGEYIMPVVDREKIQRELIEDLKKASTYMMNAGSVTVERCTKEFAQALIARIALTAGGYSLRPNKDDARSYGTMQRSADSVFFYQTARAYADSVITSGTHALNLSYQEVFVKECNYELVNNDDVIFELPFARNSTGNTGYTQGPTYNANEGNTVGAWGACKGDARVNAFYRFLFRTGDKRREFVNGLWYYSYFSSSDGSLADSVYIRNDYSVHNNKWSKLWTSEGSALGSATTDGTGINYPYMRYADVLLMYAEAANMLDGGPSDDKAVQCLTAVHERAFGNADQAFIDNAKASKEAFQKAVLDERKWEFAGENSRWRDLVRTNTYAEELVYSFLRYYSAGMQNASGLTGYEDDINVHDGYTGKGYMDNLPERIYYHTYNFSEAQANLQALMFFRTQYYGYSISVIGNVANIENMYPNQKLQSLRILNAYEPAQKPATSMITNFGFKATAWYSADFYQWGNNNNGTPKDECKYSFYGFMRGDDMGNIWLIRNGVQELFPTTIPTADQLPVVRYILPYPNTVIQRSSGAYKNYYGY